MGIDTLAIDASTLARASMVSSFRMSVPPYSSLTFDAIHLQPNPGNGGVSCSLVGFHVHGLFSPGGGIDLYGFDQAAYYQYRCQKESVMSICVDTVNGMYWYYQ